MSPQHVAEITKYTPQTARTWAKAVALGTPMYEDAHRPRHISKDRTSQIYETVLEGTKKSRGISKRKFGTMLQTAVNETRTEDKNTPKKISTRFVGDWMKENDVHTVNGEHVDNAHKIASKDPRHAASHAALMHHLHKTVPDALFFNIDKTSFEMRKAQQELTETVIAGPRPQSVKCEDHWSAATSGNCAVHVSMAVSAYGKAADLVYIVKDDKMPLDTIDVHEVGALDGTTSAEATAYIIFVGKMSKNRDVALEWILANVVVPFINTVRNREGFGADTPASLSFDGDPRQLQVLASEPMQELFRSNSIIPSKGPASCTPIFQVLDVGKNFLAAKSRFKALIRSDAPPPPHMQKRVLAAFQAHRRKYPAKTLKNGKPSMVMGQYFTDAIKCLVTSARAWEDTLAAKVIRDSFAAAGVVPFDACIIRDQCQYPWTDAQKDQFVRGVLVLSTRIGLNFELKEADFNDAQIPLNNKSKDAAPVHQRRALLLNAPHVLQDLHDQATRVDADVE